MNSTLEIAMAYIGQSNRQRVGPCIVLGMLVALVLFSNRLYAQDDNAAPQLPSADTSSREAGVDPQQPTTEPQQTTEPQEATDVSQDDASQQPAGKNLETGLPLHSLVSPLRWGRLSLLSFSAFSAYDNNY